MTPSTNTQSGPTTKLGDFLQGGQEAEEQGGIHPKTTPSGDSPRRTTRAGRSPSVLDGVGLEPLDLGKAPPRVLGCSPACLPCPPRAAPGIIAQNDKAYEQRAPARASQKELGPAWSPQTAEAVPVRQGWRCSWDRASSGSGTLSSQRSVTLSWPGVSTSSRMGAGDQPSGKVIPRRSCELQMN